MFEIETGLEGSRGRKLYKTVSEYVTTGGTPRYWDAVTRGIEMDDGMGRAVADLGEV